MASLIPWGRGRSRRGDLATRRTEPYSRLQDQFDALWNRFLSTWSMPTEKEFASERMWDVDLEESDKEVIVRAELPGFEPKDLDVQVNNEILTIKAEKKQESQAEGSSEGPRERRYAMYRRTLTLPPGTNPEKAEANYRNGVLELHFARSPEAAGKRIPVHSEGQPHAAISQKKAPQGSASERHVDRGTASSSPGAKQG